MKSYSEDDELHTQLSKDASLLAHMIDIGSDQVLLSELTEQDYKNASFLDRRIITPTLKWQAVKWEALDGAELPKALPPYYIFHIGHVGSTLISRLLGESPDILALREPQILRDLGEIYAVKDTAQSPWSPEKYQSRFDQVVAWSSRTFRDNQRAMIKASSFISNLSNDLIGRENKSLFLYVGLQSYLETILAGEGSRQEAEQLAEFRRAQFVANLGADIESLSHLSHVQKIALGWLSGMITLVQTAEQKDQGLIRWQDFNEFLKHPGRDLTDIAQFFDLELANINDLIAGPIMNRYSKDPTHAYTPDLRQQLLEQARRNFSSEIKTGIMWVEGLAGSYKSFDKIMSRIA